jgi:tetratricopeptide (TPR) repeat protein
VTAEGVKEAIRLTSQALHIFGDDALLHAADGIFHYLAYDFGFSHNEETLVRIEASSNRALELNPEVALAWYSMGLGKYKRGDMLGFVQNMRRAVGLERNSEMLFFLAFALAEIDRTEEARVFADEAIERDPLLWTGQLSRSVVDLFDGKLEFALTRFRYWTKDMPDHAFAQWWLGQALAYAGEEDEAIAAFERGARSGTGVISELCELGVLSLRGEQRSAVDLYKSRESLREAASSDETFPRYLAMCFARIKEYDLALQWLERAIQWGFTNHRFLSEYDRFLAPLRGDPRFEALMERAREKQRAFEI